MASILPKIIESLPSLFRYVYFMILKPILYFTSEKAIFPLFLSKIHNGINWLSKKLTLYATHRWPQYCQRSFGPCPHEGLQAWVFHDPLYPWTRAYTGCIGNNVRGHWPIKSSSHVFSRILNSRKLKKFHEICRFFVFWPVLNGFSFKAKKDYKMSI